MMVPTRQTADERRTAVLAAAITEFARSGYAGTSTDAIAKRAGISQPYLFRLFGTKKDLFVATYDLVGDRILRALTTACESAEPDDRMGAMGLAYLELMQDPELLEVQMHGFAAATSDPDIARSCRRTFQDIYRMLEEHTEMTDEEVREFFASGMMISVMSAIDLLSLPDAWAQSLCPDPGKFEAATAAAEAIRNNRQSRVDLTTEESA
jgi:AcrR family transcriptional regulator